MAISQVRAKINGTWYTLTLNSSTGKYEASITAPGATSYNQSGGYYNVEVEATNTAGTKGTADGSTLAGLRLVVKERVAPVITILSPSSGAYVTNSKQPVVFTIVDEDGAVGGDVIVEILVAHELYVEAAAVGLTELAPFAEGLRCRHPLRHGNGNGEK